VLIYDIANIYATQRKPDAPSKARGWYERGWDVLREMPECEHRVREEIRLCNGLALVDYHEGNDRRALELEVRAKSLMEQTAEKFPEVERAHCSTSTRPSCCSSVSATPTRRRACSKTSSRPRRRESASTPP
jgi:hypothetical protein